MYYLIFLILSIFDRFPDNHCPLGVKQIDSAKYIVKQQELYQTPTNVPALVPYQARQITNILFQTNERNQVSRQMYETLLNNIDMNPEFEYRYYNADERRNFLKFMGQRYVNAYDTLLPAAYKADLFRYSAVYHYGGCYMDAGSISTKPLAQILKSTDIFVSSEDSEGKGLNSAFFCATKGNKILQYTLEEILKTVESHNYGENDLDITGPFKFLKAFRKYFDDPTLKAIPKDYGNGIRLLHRTFQGPCLIATIWDGTDPCIISKYPAYVTDMGRYTGRLRYGEMWLRRQVFRQSEDKHSDT